MNQTDRLRELEERWDDCRRCELFKTRKNIVFGEGNPSADILVIGEAPGEFEDLAGRPFMGPAGEVLDGFVSHMSLDRHIDLYVTNTICCRPTVANEDERTGGSIDLLAFYREARVTASHEVEFAALGGIYSSRLGRAGDGHLRPADLMDRTQRRGNQVLFGRVPKMESLRGNMQTFHIQGVHTELRYPVMPLYHTAYLLRTFDRRVEGPWGRTMRDWVKICKIIDHLREVYYGTERPNREKSND